MDNSISTSLCKGMRACGLPKKQTYQILNLVTKWYDCCGPEWTVKRLKDYRQWYETHLAGNPMPPAWCRKTRKNLPIGEFGWLFKQPVGKVLGILSLGTVFRESQPSPTQMEKFHHGLRGNGTGDFPNKPPESIKAGFLTPYSKERMNILSVVDLSSIKLVERCEQYPEITDLINQYRRQAVKPPSYHPFDRVRDILSKAPEIPSIACITGESIPVNSGKLCLHPKTIVEKVEALRQSWADIPQPVIEFLNRENSLDQVPVNVLGNEYQLELDRPRTRVTGRLGCIQQGELKARWIANPNRVVQHYMRPLQMLYMETLRALPTDCTHDQESGVNWVQEKLRKGIRLSGSDLTSASDLLELTSSEKMVRAVYQFDTLANYKSHLQLFSDISRLEWFNPFSNTHETWMQGQPLGTAPSFGLLGLTNNAAALIAAYRCGLSPNDSYRVIGDDIIMRSEMLPYYEEVIDLLGGEINHSKTLTSDQVAEFAGRIITRDRVYLKKVNYIEPSDQSFMAIMSQLGPQAIMLLKPRQRAMYQEFRYVPGVAVDGPWPKDSFGEPFASRYQWYLDSPLSEEKLEPDRKTITHESTLLAWQVSGHSTEEAEKDLPFPMDDSYLESEIPDMSKMRGDPRKVDGMSTLEVLENTSKKENFESYTNFRAKQAKDKMTAEQSVCHPDISGEKLARRKRILGSISHLLPKEDMDSPEIDY